MTGEALPLPYVQKVLNYYYMLQEPLFRFRLVTRILYFWTYLKQKKYIYLNSFLSEHLSTSINLTFQNKSNEKLNLLLSLEDDVIKGYCSHSEIPHVFVHLASVCLSVTPILLPASHFAMDPSDLSTLKMCLFPSFAFKDTAHIKRGASKRASAIQPPVSH